VKTRSWAASVSNSHHGADARASVRTALVLLTPGGPWNKTFPGHPLNPTVRE